MSVYALLNSVRPDRIMALRPGRAQCQVPALVDGGKRPAGQNLRTAGLQARADPAPVTFFAVHHTKT
jgi:hypothetical protein